MLTDKETLRYLLLRKGLKYTRRKISPRLSYFTERGEGMMKDRKDKREYKEELQYNHINVINTMVIM
jgi:hypothetical protein